MTAEQIEAERQRFYEKYPKANVDDPHKSYIHSWVGWLARAEIAHESHRPPSPAVVGVPVEPTDAQEAAGGIVLWEKQFEGTPWKNKVKLIDPASMGEYNEVARHVYEAMLRAAGAR